MSIIVLIRLQTFFKKTGNPEPVTSDYLRSFEDFQKLEIIRVEVGDVETFFRDFTLPISIKSIEIWFNPNKRGFGLSANAAARALKEDVKSPDFYERWRKLKNLESLFMLGADFDFAQELLKRIPQLKELKLRSTRLLSGAVVFDFVEFFKPLEHINEGLEVLDIGSASPFLMKEDSIKEIHFSKLKRLGINGHWEKNELKSYLGLLRSHDSRENRLIEFSGGAFYSQSQEFFKLLKQLNDIYRVEDGLEMNFYLHMKPSSDSEWKDEFIKQLQEFTEHGREMKNLSLTLKSPISLEGLFYEQLDIFKAFGKLFKKFEM